MRSPARLSSRVLWAVTLLLQQACYVYVPVSSGVAPKAGERAQLDLTLEGTTELARYLGPQVREAEGAVASVADDGTLTVAVDMVRLRSGIRQPWTGEGVVAFPRAYVAEMRERTLRKRRSIVFAVALTGGLIGLAVIALNAGGAQGNPGDGTPPPP